MKLVLAKTLWVFLFFILTIAEFSVCIRICRESEQQALETLKKEAYDPYNILSSWIVGKDCCAWYGVVCHILTSHVNELDMSDGAGLRIDNLEWLPSLVNLEYLGMLNVDLSRATNWLQVTNMLPSIVHLSLRNCSLQHIPPLLDHHNFSSLETLHLSSNNFTSPIPKWIFNLSRLVDLDLSYNTFTGPFPKDSVNLTSLKTFRASGNSFNCPLPRWLFDLQSLETLDLRNSSIEGAVPNPVSNLSSIITIDLSGNALTGNLPNIIGKSKKLESLYLSDNLFEGEVSELFNSMDDCFQNCSLLSDLRLDNNKLSGTLPRILGRLSMLHALIITNNRLEGIVTGSHFTNLTQLGLFDASGNKLTLEVSQNWIPPFQASTIKMGGWKLHRQFPTWLQTQEELSYLDISSCGLEGEVPSWFWNLSSQLQTFNISHNHLVGEVPSILGFVMDFASNNFSGPLPQFTSEVKYLGFSNNFFSGGLSHFLCEVKSEYSYELEFLNLGGNDLSGEIPDCWMNWPNLKVLILRDNNLIGGLPRSMEALSNLKSLDLRRNRLTDLLSSSLGNCTKLLKMDLAENEFIGPLPRWLGMRLSHLIILSLRSNKFLGQLPLELCFLQNLQILDLANNTFSGVIPKCIGNFTAMVTGTGRLEAEEENELYYTFFYYDTRMRESAMVTTKGNVYQYDTILKLVTSMDMSNNNLSGDIPTSLTNLGGLRFCNFSKNHLAGGIPNGIDNMKVLESFDLSENQLSGQIPQSLSSLSSLAYLNISYNNLSGKIPLSTQLQSFSPSSYQGNKLCGLPLLVNCSTGGPVPNLDENEEEESSDDEWDGFYISMAIGFALSFWGLGASLIFKRTWRHAYYRFLGNTWNSLRVKLHL